MCRAIWYDRGMKSRKPIPPLFRVILETARNSGQELLMSTLGTKARSWQPMVRIQGTVASEIREALPKWMGAAKEEVQRWLPTRLRVPSLKAEMEEWAFAALSGAALTGGVYVGSQIPNQNIRLTLKEDTSQTILIHSPVRFMGEVSVDWLVALIQKTIDSNVLEPEDARRLEGLKLVFSRLSHGLGWGGQLRSEILRRFSGRPWSFTFQFPVDEQSFRLIESLFSAKEVKQYGKEVLAHEDRA